jgi:hypothetical protein
MATRGVAITIQYTAWNTSTQTGQTADAANHTLRWIKDGVAAAPTNTPTEVDATNCPGVYKIALTASETDCSIGTLCGKSSTADVSIIPITIQFERLPDAAPGANGGVAIIGSAPLTNLDVAVSTRASGADYTAARAAKLDNLDATITSRAPAATALSNATWTDARAAKLDNLDTTISSRAPAATALSNATWTDARASKLDNLDVAVSTRLAASAYVAPDNAGIAAVKAQTDKMQFDAANRIIASAQIVGDKTGYSLTSSYDRAKDALKYTEYVAPDNAGITAIKAQTDRMQFNASNHILAHSMNAGGGGGSVEVVVQPLGVETLLVATDGGTITGWRYAKLVVSWLVDQDVSGHDLRLIIFDLANPANKIAEYSGAEIAVTAQGTKWLVRVSGDQAKTPLPGTYGYVMRDQTSDTVILQGRLRVFDAPDAA